MDPSAPVRLQRACLSCSDAPASKPQQRTDCATPAGPSSARPSSSSKTRCLRTSRAGSTASPNTKFPTTPSISRSVTCAPSGCSSRSTPPKTSAASCPCSSLARGCLRPSRWTSASSPLWLVAVAVTPQPTLVALRGSASSLTPTCRPRAARGTSSWQPTHHRTGRFLSSRVAWTKTLKTLNGSHRPQKH